MARKIPGTSITANTLPASAIVSNTITVTQLQTTVVTQIQAGASGGPKISAITYPNSATAVANTGNDTVILTGTGFESGVTVVVNGNAAPSVTRANANSLSFTTPALSSTTYPIYVVNPDGGTAIFVPGMQVSGKPVWTTTSPLSSWGASQALSRNLVATSDSAVSYSLAVGSSLPGGLSLASNGLLSGTLSSQPGSETTYNFTVVATDAELQTSSKAFSINASIGYFASISPAYDGNTNLDLTTGNITLSNSGTWTLTPCSTFAVNVAMWGAGGQSASAGTGGAGGYSHGTVTLYSGNTYTIRVGKFDGGGDGPGGAGNGGGYTAVFSGTETFANSVIIAGGGGGAPPYYNSGQTGGAGGGSSGQASSGGGGTQSAGGAGGVNGIFPASGTGAAGGQLTGGAGAAGNQGYQGGGGGSGYYGGGGGLARVGGDGIGGGGGGGSGYLHPSLVANGNTQVGSAGTAANSASGLRGTSGNADTNGKIIIIRTV